MKNDIEPAFGDYGINISEIGNDKTFFNFIKYINSKDPNDVIIVPECTFAKFYTNEQKCEKLNKEMKYRSLKNMISYLKKHIENEINDELIIEKVKIEKKVKEKYKLHELINKLDDLRQDSSEV